MDHTTAIEENQHPLTDTGRGFKAYPTTYIGRSFQEDLLLNVYITIDVHQSIPNTVRVMFSISHNASVNPSLAQRKTEED